MADRRSFLKRVLLVPLGIAVADEAKPERIRRVHLKDVHVAGLQYHEFASHEAISTLNIGDELSLRRESQNPHDEFAIGVYDRHGRKLGFIPMYQNRTIARIMDQGVTVEASVEYLLDADVPWKRVTIRISEVIPT